MLCLGVYVRGRFIENEDARIAEDGAGNCDALFLTAGELAALFADAGIVTIGPAHDELVGIGGACCRDDLVWTGRGIRVPDVVGDGAVEQELILEDNPNLVT